MNIAELFVEISLKSTDKTVTSINAVTRSIQETASVSLEAKAAILGAMYALEHFFAESGKTGTNLTNFNALTGVAVQTLQEYQYAARQVGVSNEETASSFKALQDMMTKTKLGEGAPAGWAMVGNLTGGFTKEDVNKFMQNPELLLQKLQVYAQKEQDIGLRNRNLKSFGLTDNMITALTRGAFTPQALQKAPTYSDKEVASLDKANIAWSNLSTKIAMAIGHLNAAHGQQLVKDFTILVDLGLRLADILLNITERTHFFEKMQKGFHDAGQEMQAFETNLAGFAAKLGDSLGQVADKSHALDHIGVVFKELSGIFATAEGLIIRAANAIGLFSDKMTLVQAAAKTIDLIFKGWEQIFTGLQAVLDAVANASPQELQQTAFGGGLVEKAGSSAISAIGEIASGVFASVKDQLSTKSAAGETSPFPAIKLASTSAADQLLRNPGIEPKTGPVTQNKSVTQNVNTQQTFNFTHEGKNAKEIADHVKKASAKIHNDVLRQSPAVVRVN